MFSRGTGVLVFRVYSFKIILFEVLVKVIIVVKGYYD